MICSAGRRVRGRGAMSHSMVRISYLGMLFFGRLEWIIEVFGLPWWIGHGAVSLALNFIGIRLPAGMVSYLLAATNHCSDCTQVPAAPRVPTRHTGDDVFSLVEVVVITTQWTATLFSSFNECSSNYRMKPLHIVLGRKDKLGRTRPSHLSNQTDTEINLTMHPTGSSQIEE
ncbi:hypothetical protein FB45DRAFT_880612 [Roridomyces roridus]|uniref:Uncharacterized protein n=1 Tax=Roridomyces roridus TaxID=1738132 RepID=A0AAD7F6A0_9AGAR|nr:hypothetical protein FB45DRAFT_880612 [Roridomyces roridus]